MEQSETADRSAHVGEELRKTYRRYQQNGFFEKFFSGPNILDIGYKGYLSDAQPVTPNAIGVDLDYPGYDGRTLPFADQSQDTVLVSHVLEHIPDYRQALSDWFRVLRIGGFMVIAVPHQYLYERAARPPSLFNQDHKRFYTAGSLLAEVEEALDPASYRLRLLEENDEAFDYDIPPEIHAEGCYELVMVLERVRRPAYADAMLQPVAAAAPSKESFAGHYLHVGSPAAHEPLMVIEPVSQATRILILKLDHRGDFITAYPAFKALRERFAGAHLTLACGPWMESEARQLGWFDDLILVDFFPEIASEAYTDGYAGYATHRFITAVAGRFWDLAIDLRVDRDTRHLLTEVQATHRAGFGNAEEFSFLDIFMPFINPTLENRSYRRVLAPANFNARVGQHLGYAVLHESRRDTAKKGDFLVFGPWETFELGEWRMEVALEALRGAFDVDYDVCSQAGAVIHKEGTLKLNRTRHPVFILNLTETVERMEIRLRAAETGRLQPFRFMGVNAIKRGTMPALHQQEMQMLLTELVSLRMKNPFVEGELRA